MQVGRLHSLVWTGREAVGSEESLTAAKSKGRTIETRQPAEAVLRTQGGPHAHAGSATLVLIMTESLLKLF